jgi:hypothetical protein
MKNKNYGIFMILVSIIVVVLYTIWVPASYLINNGERSVILSDIFPPPIWGLIIPMYLLILFVTFVFGWVGWNLRYGPPQEDISIKDLGDE